MSPWIHFMNLLHSTPFKMNYELNRDFTFSAHNQIISLVDGIEQKNKEQISSNISATYCNKTGIVLH